MSDSTAYDLAADLTDFLSDAVAGITPPSGCTLPKRIYTSAGEPDAYNCPEIAVWSSAISPSDIPNREITPDQSFCAHGHYVQLNWRYTHCIEKSTDGRTAISVEKHEADAECFYTIVFGLYRRLQVGAGEIFTGITDCKRITGGAIEFGARLGSQLRATQTLRVQVELIDPADDSS